MARPDRDEAAAGLAARELESLPTASLLVLEDPTDRVAQAARAACSSVRHWSRRSASGPVWPVFEPPVETVALRLPRAREELQMLAHIAAGALVPGGRLLVYGANDEGIRSASRDLEPIFGRVGTLATGGHARLLGAARPRELPGLRLTADDWRTEHEIEAPWSAPGEPTRLKWVSYPGVFAHGRVDEGTRVLAECLRAEFGSGRRRPQTVLDWASGSGLLAATMRHVCPDAELTLLDLDRLALRAAAENVSGARQVHSDGWASLESGAAPGSDAKPGAISADGVTPGVRDRWNLVVANPPYHRGKSESLDVIDHLLAGLGMHLDRAGELWMVVQRRLAIEALAQRRGRSAEPVLDRGTFRIWRVR